MRIVIDPGHGGNDPGAIGVLGTKEKDINLIIALKVKTILQRYNIKIMLTRDKDATIGLEDRVKIANAYNADCFVSIHCNCAENSTANGTETYAYFSSIAGTQLATYIQNALIAEIKLIDRGVKHKDFYVLRKTKMPAVLVEIAFLSNIVEEKLLNSESFLDKVSIGIVKGIIKYLGVDYIEEKELNEIKLNLHGKQIIVKGIFKNNVNYIPIRFLEQLGYDLQWKDNTVFINYK